MMVDHLEKRLARRARKVAAADSRARNARFRGTGHDLVDASQDCLTAILQQHHIVLQAVSEERCTDEFGRVGHGRGFGDLGSEFLDRNGLRLLVRYHGEDDTSWFDFILGQPYDLADSAACYPIEVSYCVYSMSDREHLSDCWSISCHDSHQAFDLLASIDERLALHLSGVPKDYRHFEVRTFDRFDGHYPVFIELMNKMAARFMAQSS